MILLPTNATLSNGPSRGHIWAIRSDPYRIRTYGEKIIEWPKQRRLSGAPHFCAIREKH